MSVNKTKDQEGRVNTRRKTDHDIPFGKKRVRETKPTNPDEKKRAETSR